MSINIDKTPRMSRSLESAVMVLFVQRITANLFCRWHVRRKTQSPSSLFRLSYGEHSDVFIFHHVMAIEHFLSLLNLDFPYWLLFFPPSGRFWLQSRIIFSTWWCRSASRRLAKAFSSVQFLLTSSGNDTLYNGTFLFLTGSVVRPEEVLFQCCNLHSEKCSQYKTLTLLSDSFQNPVCSLFANLRLNLNEKSCVLLS